MILSFFYVSVASLFPTSESTVFALRKHGNRLPVAMLLLDDCIALGKEKATRRRTIVCALWLFPYLLAACCYSFCFTSISVKVSMISPT